MKFMMPNKRLLAVAIAADFVAVFPLFVVLAAQGQITEVNPSGVRNPVYVRERSRRRSCQCL